MANTGWHKSSFGTMVHIRGSSSALCAVILLVFFSTISMSVDGFLLSQRKEALHNELRARQLRGHMPGGVPDVKKEKKGVSVSVVNVVVDNENPGQPSHTVSTGTGTHLPNPGQCNRTGEKIDCATFCVKKDECLARGCCYTEVRDSPEPWCYLPQTSLVSQCRGREDSRLQCGYYNIERDECEGLGCCWRPTSTSGIPWCYQADTGSTDESQGPAPIQCGQPPIEPNVNLRIVGGVEAVPHSWPWMVSLQWGSHHACGGSLINDRWVVSAAHCQMIFNDLSSARVVIGAHNLGSPNPTYTERIAAERVIANPKYSGSAMSNDIMLIKLSRPVNFTEAVRPVCLPEPFQTLDSGTRCWSTGWGTTSSGGMASEVLNQVALPLIDNEVCNQPGWYEGAIDDTMVCAGYEEGGRDSCQGDSGGPLVCNQDGQWILYGAVSWGHGCAYVNKPGLYARTAAYVKWINEQIRENSD